MKIQVRIEGVSPLLLCRFSDQAQMDATSGTRSSQLGSRPGPFEEAQSFLYVDEQKIPIIPSPMLSACITEGGKFFKAGKSKVTTNKTSLIPACVSLEEIYYPIQSVSGWKVDSRPVRIPSTGGRILRHRPCFDDWAVDFDVELDCDVMAPKLLREIIDAAGKRCGIGAFRPSCKGPFGRFVVTNWKEED